MLKSIGNHLANWAEVYLWAPLSLLLVPGAGLVCYLLTGRATQENLDWLVALAGRFLTCILAIAIVSIAREASGIWMTKAEAIENPLLYSVQTITKLGFFYLILRTLTS
jgi:hypothetical protein